MTGPPSLATFQETGKGLGHALQQTKALEASDMVNLLSFQWTPCAFKAQRLQILILQSMLDVYSWVSDTQGSDIDTLLG